MSIYKYAVLQKVVERASFTKAAIEMGYTQSGVSHAIKSLEEEFGFKLLTRNRSGVELTNNGKRIIKSVNEIMNWNDKLIQTVTSINGLVEGKIRIATFTSIPIWWLSGIMKSFLSDHPNIEFELIDGDYEETEQWIAEYKVDCGFVNLADLKEKLHAVSIKKDKLYVVLPAGHRLLKYDKIPVGELNNEYFILPGEGMDSDVGRIIKDNSLALKIRYHAKNDYSTIEMVKNGLGISILSRLLLEPIPKGIDIREFDESVSRHIAFATLPIERRTPAVNLFEKYLIDQILFFPGNGDK